MDRVNADILRQLSVSLRKKGDPGLENASILRVETSADLSSARVFVTGGEEILNGLQGFFKNEIAQNLKIRRTPNLRFIRDDGQKNADRIEEILQQIRGDN